MVGPETPLIVFLISTAERQAVLAADALLAGALDKAALDRILGQFARDTEAGDLTKAALNAIQNLKAHLKGTLLRPGPHGPAEAQPGPDFDALIDPLLDPAPVPRTGEASKDPSEQAGGPNPLAGKPALS